MRPAWARHQARLTPLLQAQEDAAAAAATQRAAAAAHLRGSHDGQQQIIRLVEDAARKAQQYEDEMAQACALSVIPLDRLTAAAQEAAAVSRAMGEDPPLPEQDGAPTLDLITFSFRIGFDCWDFVKYAPAAGDSLCSHGCLHAMCR